MSAYLDADIDYRHGVLCLLCPWCHDTITTVEAGDTLRPLVSMSRDHEQKCLRRPTEPKEITP